MLKIEKQSYNYRDDTDGIEHVDVWDFVSDYALYKNGDSMERDVPLEDKPTVMAKMFGRLVEVLVNKKVLDAKDLKEIVGEYQEIKLVEVDESL